MAGRAGAAGRIEGVPTLILLRHGESEWNSKNLFTGWVDVDLTDTGEAEGRRGGELTFVVQERDGETLGVRYIYFGPR